MFNSVLHFYDRYTGQPAYFRSIKNVDWIPSLNLGELEPNYFQIMKEQSAGNFIQIFLLFCLYIYFLMSKLKTLNYFSY